MPRRHAKKTGPGNYVKLMQLMLHHYLASNIANIVLDYAVAFRGQCNYVNKQTLDLHCVIDEEYIQTQKNDFYHVKTQHLIPCPQPNAFFFIGLNCWVEEDIQCFHVMKDSKVVATLVCNHCFWIQNTQFIVCTTNLGYNEEEDIQIFDVETLRYNDEFASTLYPYRLTAHRSFTRGVYMDHNDAMVFTSDNMKIQPLHNYCALPYYQFPYFVQISSLGGVFINNTKTCYQVEKWLIWESNQFQLANEDSMLKWEIHVDDTTFYQTHFLALLVRRKNRSHFLLLDLDTLELVFQSCSRASRIFGVGKNIILQQNYEISCWE